MIRLTGDSNGRHDRRVPATAGEGTERRYFYGTVWSVTIAQAVLMVLWKVLPRGHAGDVSKLAVYVVGLCAVGFAA